MRKILYILITLVAFGVFLIELSPLPRVLASYLEDQTPIANLEIKRPALILLGGDLITYDFNKEKFLNGRRHKGLYIAEKLFKSKKIEYIILTGYDHGPKKTVYSDKESAKKYLMEKGISEEKILVTRHCLNTFDDAKKANDILNDYNIKKDVYLISSGTHLPRAIWSFRQFGINTVGVAVDSWAAILPPNFDYTHDYNRYFVIRKSLHEILGLLYYKIHYDTP